MRCAKELPPSWKPRIREAVERADREFPLDKLRRYQGRHCRLDALSCDRRPELPHPCLRTGLGGRHQCDRGSRRHGPDEGPGGPGSRRARGSSTWWSVNSPRTRPGRATLLSVGGSTHSAGVPYAKASFHDLSERARADERARAASRTFWRPLKVRTDQGVVGALSNRDLGALGERGPLFEAVDEPWARVCLQSEDCPCPSPAAARF